MQTIITSSQSSSLDLPVGTILPYTGKLSDIPSGWYLCDGSNGTPDLRDRFLTGVGCSYNLGDTGGENFHALTIDEMPSHRHNAPSGYAGYFRTRSNAFYGKGPSRTLGWGTASGVFEVVESGLRSEGNADSNATEAIIGMNIGKFIFSEGDNKPHENRPPYYAVYYIMRVK